MTMQTRTYTCYTYAAAGGFDWTTADVRMLLFMTNSTAGDEDNAIEFLDDFTTLDEFDGANYVRKALTNQTRTKDFTNLRTILDADDLVYTDLGAGTRSVAGALAYLEGASDGARIPLAALVYGTARTPDGSNFTVAFPATGLIIIQGGPTT
jgi:hypothetical protein